MFGGRFLNARHVNLIGRLINLVVHSESNNILSLRSISIQMGVGYFFETPGIDNYFVSLAVIFL